MRLLWSLPKAAPALLRHAGAYLELAAQDLERYRRELTAQILATAVMAVGALLALFMGCLLVVALTWDTRYRVAAIAVMGGGFLTVAALAALYRANVARDSAPLLDGVRREWREDRVILERIMAGEE